MARSAHLAVLALVAVALTGGCLGAVADGSGQQSNDATNRTVSVTGSGQATAAADRAVVHVAVVARGENANVARQRLAENVSSLRTGLAEAGVAEDQIVTSGYDIGEEPHRPRETESEPVAVARQSFRVQVNDTDRVGAVVDAAVASGATRVDGVSFTLSADRRDELESQALTKAMAHARSKATTVAGEANMTIVEAKSVSTSGDDRPVFLRETAADGGGGTTIDGGPVTVSATVQVTYRAT